MLLTQNRSGRAGTPTPGDEAFVPPLPYPEGWFSVGFSSEIEPGRVLTRQMAGQDVVLYRTRRGELRTVGPYCPHLGAHLGTAGRVDGENLVCSFHNFAYGPDGTCVRTGYGVKPPRARVETFPVVESAGVVFVWYSRDGSPPAWQLPMLPSRNYPKTSFRREEFPGHPQDVVENAVDLGHLSEFHRFRGIEIVEPISFDESHFTVKYRWSQRFPLLGERVVEYETSVHGLGYILVTAAIPRLGVSVRLWALATAIAPWRVDFRFATSVAVAPPRHFPQGIGRYTGDQIARCLTMLSAIAVAPEASRDVPIWSSKAYLEHPRLVKGDGPIGAFRQWAKQFYPSPETAGEQPHREHQT